MIVLSIIIASLLLALSINAFFKFHSYKQEDKSIWQDGDSVRVRGKEGEAKDDGFMNRIA